MRTFGSDIFHFALTLDRVDEEVWNQVTSLVQSYFLRELHIEVFEFLVPMTVDNAPALGTYWRHGASKWSSSIKRNGLYQGQVSYSFDRNLDMWIVAEDEDSTLKGPHAYRDLLKNAPKKEITAYVDTNTRPQPMKTSILLPMHIRNQAVGLLNLESTEHLRPSSYMHKELRLVTDALSELYVKHDRKDDLQRATHHSLELLREQHQSQPAWQHSARTIARRALRLQ